MCGSSQVDAARIERVCHLGKGGTVEGLLIRLRSGGTDNAVETTVSVQHSFLLVLSIDYYHAEL